MNVQNTYEIKGKNFIGYVLKYPDPLKAGRYAVYIPELMPGHLPGTDYVWCKNNTGNYNRSRDPFTKEYFSYGNYQPIQPGSRVIVTFMTNEMSSGIIINIDSTYKVPNNLRDDYYIIHKTKNGSLMYVNDQTNVFHLQHAKGKSNIYMTDKDIIIQLNNINKNNELQRNVGLIINESGIEFKVKNARYKFTDTGFAFQLDKKAGTSITFSDGGIQLQAKKFISLSSDEGAIHIYSQKAFINGFEETHILANDLRLTGSQKAQLSGTTVNVQGWFDAHVKGMHVGIDSFIMTNFNSMIHNMFSTVYYNNFSSMINFTSTIETHASGTYGLAAPTILQDGLVISNLGAGGSVSASLGGVLSTSSLSLFFTMMSTNTTFLMNDPAGAMASVNSVLAGTIAGTAGNAIGFIPDPSLSTFNDSKDVVSSLAQFNLNDEATASKFVQPDKIMSI